jgi:hypothetical protein
LQKRVSTLPLFCKIKEKEELKEGKTESSLKTSSAKTTWEKRSKEGKRAIPGNRMPAVRMYDDLRKNNK